MNPFELMQRHLTRPTSTRELGYLFLFVVATGAIWAGLYIWDRQRRLPGTPQRDRRPLLERLTEVHALSEEQVRSLTELAQRRSLADPLVLFVDPRILESAVETDPARADLWRQLGVLLFGKEFSPAAHSN